MPVRIGKNCWFGAGVIILPGITIGDDVVVGAGIVFFVLQKQFAEGITGAVK